MSTNGDAVVGCRCRGGGGAGCGDVISRLGVRSRRYRRGVVACREGDGTRSDNTGDESPPASAVFDELPGVSPETRAEIEAKVAEAYPETVTVVRNADELSAMLEEKPPEWPWAAFASVPVQRRNAVESRLRDSRLGFSVPTGETARTDWDTARFVMNRLSEFNLIIDELEEFMRSPAFSELVEQCSDGTTADPGDIVHTANRLMDYHD